MIVTLTKSCYNENKFVVNLLYKGMVKTWKNKRGKENLTPCMEDGY